MNTQSTAFHILRLLETPGVGVARVATLLDWARSENTELQKLMEDRSILGQLLSETQLHSIQNNGDQALELWDRLRQKDIRVMSILDDEYPSQLRGRLGKKAPPLLTVLGNGALLANRAVGFCGSREASARGLETARDCADQLARAGVNIVSGYARGVDMATHRAALESGGTTTLVLAEGILKFKIKCDLKEVWDWERVAVVSEFLPGIPWNVRNAMRRNSTICALSRAMVLIEARSKGGSIEAGRTCLSMGLALFAPVYEGMPETAQGNRELLEQGARPLMRSRETNRANVGPILEAVRNDDGGKDRSDGRRHVDRHGQLSLFG